MTIFISHYKSRTCEYDITISDANGDAVELFSGDVVRVKIWRDTDGRLLLDLVSGTPSDEGSSLTRANPTRFKLAQGDADWTVGAYSIEATIVDNSDDDKIRHADNGVFVLHKTPGGNIGS